MAGIAFHAARSVPAHGPRNAGYRSYLFTLPLPRRKLDSITPQNQLAHHEASQSSIASRRLDSRSSHSLTNVPPAVDSYPPQRLTTNILQTPPLQILVTPTCPPTNNLLCPLWNRHPLNSEKLLSTISISLMAGKWSLSVASICQCNTLRCLLVHHTISPEATLLYLTSRTWFNIPSLVQELQLSSRQSHLHL